MVTSSAQRKFARGVEQMNTLCDEVRRYQESAAFSVRAEPEIQSPEEVLYRCYAVEKKPAPDHWPLLAGDAIHNLRASLDHAVWEATPEASRSRRTQFPICDTPTNLENHREVLDVLPAHMAETIENVQPYNWIDGLKWDRLVTLRDLSNLDKHRTLTTVASFVELPWVSYDEADVTFTESGEGSVLKDGTHVISYIVRGPGARDTFVAPGMHFEVRIEGHDLLSTFERMIWRLALLHDALEGNRSIPVFRRLAS